MPNNDDNNVKSIYSSWKHITNTMRGSDGIFTLEAEREWEKLWQEHVEGENLVRTPLDDVILLSTLGWEIAIQRGDAYAALSRSTRCLEHPHWEQSIEIDQLWLKANIAQARWQTGEHEQALKEYREILALYRPRHKLPILFLRSNLYYTIVEQPSSMPADEDIAQLSADVIRYFRGCARLAAGITPGLSTYGELSVAFEKTYPIAHS